MKSSWAENYGNQMSLKISVYSEDSGDYKKRLATVRNIVHSMWRIHPRKTPLQPPAIDPMMMCEAYAGTTWKSGRTTNVAANNQFRNLLRLVTAEILSGRVVLFHIDGDTPWTKRSSQNQSLLDHKKAFISVLLSALRLRAPDENWTAYRLRKRFIFIIPYYSIEAWTYANVRYLLSRLPNREHANVFWSSDLGLLDEIGLPSPIKSLLSINSQLNHELTAPENNFPANDLYSLNKSYRSTWDRFAHLL